MMFQIEKISPDTSSIGCILAQNKGCICYDTGSMHLVFHCNSSVSPLDICSMYRSHPRSIPLPCGISCIHDLCLSKLHIRHSTVCNRHSIGQYDSNLQMVYFLKHHTLYLRNI